MDSNESCSDDSDDLVVGVDPSGDLVVGVDPSIDKTPVLACMEFSLFSAARWRCCLLRALAYLDCPSSPELPGDGGGTLLQYRSMALWMSG